MMDGELFVVYRECDEDRSSEAAMGEGGRAAPRFVSPKRWVREARGRARAVRIH